MKKLIVCALMALGFSQATLAKDGYTLKAKYTDAKDSMVLLCHYYGKGSTVFKDDSAKLSSKGEVIFKSDKKIVGGLYMILFEDKSSTTELVISNGDNIEVELSKAKPIETIKFKGNGENKEFYDYQRFLTEYGKGYQKIESQLASAKNKKDTTKIYDELKVKSKELQAYRADYQKKYPKNFLSKLFKAIWEPDIPTELPNLPNGGKDSSFPRHFYKAHYWDNYDFSDDRLIYTPLYERKVDDYMSRLVIPMPDSVNADCDMLLKKAENSPETFKYTLWYLTRWTETSKIMGMDESFVYLVENYYMKGKATWLEQADLDKYIDRAKKIAPNMIGQPAMDLRAQDSLGKTIPLSSVKADYTILIFWSPTCGHCKTELPRFDSLYKSELKKRNVKIYAVEADNEDAKWRSFIKDNKLNDGWIHVADPNHVTNFRAFYDVYSTPTVYLLDENKIIRGKRIDEKNVVGLIDWLEKKKKNAK